MSIKNSASIIGDTDCPLCVDLDGTLVRTDTLIESFFALLRKNFLFIFLVPMWLLRGKAYLKEQIARRVDLDVTLLPYNDQFLDFLKEQHELGRRLVLATAANKKYAHAVSSHLGLFDAVLSSDADNNLSGSRKLQKLQVAFGDSGFDYAGNSLADVEILTAARQALLVNPEPGVLSAVKKATTVIHIFDRSHKNVLTYLKALRVHQWLKNLLLFVPLLAAHRVSDFGMLGHAGLAFLSFSLCASSVYLLNDLVDMPADRVHPRKCMRPLASGEMPIIHGVLLIPVLLIVAVLIALLLPSQFLLVLGVYYIFTLAYSMWFKRVVVLDVIILAGLYTMRVLAGAAAVTIVPSFWLLAFSMFIFLSLAMIKRFTELLEVSGENKQSDKVRGYYAEDMELLKSMGVASGYLGVLVLALYINSPGIAAHYANPQVIWLLCPLLLYWVSRTWLVATRNKMHDDPVVFAVKDKVSRLVVLVAVFLFLLADIPVDFLMLA